MRIVFLLAFLLTNAAFILAQHRYTDSLTTIVRNTETSNKTRVMLLSELANIVRYQDESEGLKLAQEALQLAKGEADALYKVYAYDAVSASYLSLKNNKQAHLYMDSSLLYARKTTDVRAKSWAYYQWARMLSYEDKYKEALPQYLKALQLIKGKEYWSQEAGIYYGIYGVFSTWEDLDNQDKYALLALDAAQKSKDPNRLCEAWQALGTAVEYRYIQNKDKKLLDSATRCLYRAIDVYEQNVGKMKMMQLITIPCVNLANIYNQHFPASKQVTDSIRHYAMLAFNYATKDKDTRLQAVAFGLMNEDAKRNGNYELAETYLLQAQSLLLSNPNPDQYILASVQRDLADVVEKRGDYAGALKYQKDYLATYKKIYDTEQVKAGKSLEAKYEAKEREQQITFLKKSEALNRKQKYLYFGIAAALLGALLFMFRSYHFRLRYAMQKERVLKKEKEEAHLLARLKDEEAQLAESLKQKVELHAKLQEEQAKLKAEEAARLEAERQVVEARNELLQKEVLAGSLHVEQKNKILQDIKARLEERPGQEVTSMELNRILRQQQHLDRDFDAFKNELKEVHPKFYATLQERAGNKLTPLDLKYCAYILLKRTSKEIATLLGVEAKSARMTKYRIKLKLGLDKDASLGEYIARI